MLSLPLHSFPFSLLLPCLPSSLNFLFSFLPSYILSYFRILPYFSLVPLLPLAISSPSSFRLSMNTLRCLFLFLLLLQLQRLLLFPLFFLSFIYPQIFWLLLLFFLLLSIFPTPLLKAVKGINTASVLGKPSSETENVTIKKRAATT